MVRRNAIETTDEREAGDAALIARVVAWHNRDPLARRIGASQVTGIGVVALPFAKRAASERPDALFSEDFIAPLKTAVIARFAWHHGSPQRPGSEDWPQRNIPVDPQRSDAAAETRLLRSAAIESGSSRSRVLIGAGKHPPILGIRLRSPRRSMGALSMIATIAVGAMITGHWSQQPAAAPSRGHALIDASLQAPAVQPGADAASVAAIDPRQPVPAGSVVAAGADQPPAAPAEASADAATLPIAAEQATPAAAETPAPAATDAAQLAAAQPAVPAAAGLPEPAPAIEPASADRTTQQGVAGRSTSPNNPRIDGRARAAGRPLLPPAAAADIPASDISAVYALASASTISRQASELRVGFMNLPTEPAADRPHAEVMNVDGRWRVVIWPITSRGAAESLRKGLADRGIRTELIGF